MLRTKSSVVPIGPQERAVDERRSGEALEPAYDFRCLESDGGSLLANLPRTFGMQEADIYETCVRISQSPVS